MKQKIVLKKDGTFLSVYTDKIEQFVNVLFDSIKVERISDINFDNEKQLWEAKDKDGNVFLQSKSKKEIYEKELEWANGRLENDFN